MTSEYKDIMERLNASFNPLAPEERPASATDEQLDAVEVQIGYPLPSSYREFLRDYGGYNLHASYPVWEDGYEKRRGVFLFYGQLPDRSDISSGYHAGIKVYEMDDLFQWYPGLSLVTSTKLTERIGWPPELLPIANDGGGNETCLALYGLRPGAIFHWRNSPNEGDSNVYLVTNFFDEFMRLLERDI